MHAQKEHQKLFEERILQRKKERMQCVDKMISSKSAHQKVVLPKIGRTPLETVENVLAMNTSAQTVPVTRVFNCKLNTCWKPAHRYSRSRHNCRNQHGRI